MANYSSQVLDRWETDSYSGSYFEPDILLPSQFMTKDEEGLNGGERRLMAAILSDGVESYLEQASFYIKGLSTRVDAIEWVETQDLSYVFSFDNVCTALGIDPSYLRLGLARYVQAIRNIKAKEGGDVKDSPKWKKIRRPRKV